MKLIQIRNLRFNNVRNLGYDVLFGVEKYNSTTKVFSLELIDEAYNLDKYYTYHDFKQVHGAIDYYLRHSLSIFLNPGTINLGEKGRHQIIPFSVSELQNMKLVFKNKLQDNPLVLDYKVPALSKSFKLVNTVYLSEKFVDELTTLERPGSSIDLLL